MMHMVPVIFVRFTWVGAILNGRGPPRVTVQEQHLLSTWGPSFSSGYDPS